MYRFIPPLIFFSTTGFKFNSLRASLFTVLRAPLSEMKFSFRFILIADCSFP